MAPPSEVVVEPALAPEPAVPGAPVAPPLPLMPKDGVESLEQDVLPARSNPVASAKPTARAPEELEP